MPEHRPGTPPSLRNLESFLWHDFEQGGPAWARWVERKLPHLASAATSSCTDAMGLHAALRALQDRPADPDQAARDRFNALVAHHRIRPALGLDGTLTLVPGRVEDPVATILLEALDAQRSGVWHRFRRCRDPACRASFFDASRSGTQAWCAMQTCGSRDKMRRLRARTAASKPPSQNTPDT